MQYRGNGVLFFFSFPIFALLWLHNRSRFYSLLSNEKESSAGSGRVWDPFIDNGAFCSGLGRKWEKEREGGRRFSKVAPATALPCGPQSEGWRKEHGRDGA